MKNKDVRSVQGLDLALLPNGFADVLPPRAENEAYTVDVLMKTFQSFGYQRIKPPLLEFEESLTAGGIGEKLSSDTFRIMDPVTHRMLGVRSDITPQIARIALSRLAKAPRPLRMAYANDVLRTRGSQTRTERQFTQTGCEMIGAADHVDGDIEMCMLALIGLKKLGLSDITIDLNIPNFVSHLLSGAEDEDCAMIEKAVERRDYDALMVSGGKVAQKIAQAMQASGCYQKALSALQNIFLDQELAQSVVRLTQVCDGLSKALAELGFDDVSITVDVLERDGFEYHEGLGFTLFSGQSSGELGRGGCYHVRFGQRVPAEKAKGFTLYMDTIGKICPERVGAKKILVSQSESWKVLGDLQSQGWIVLRGNIENDDVAGSFGCSHLYKDGKIVETSNG